MQQAERAPPRLRGKPSRGQAPASAIEASTRDNRLIGGDICIIRFICEAISFVCGTHERQRTCKGVVVFWSHYPKGVGKRGIRVETVLTGDIPICPLTTLLVQYYHSDIIPLLHSRRRLLKKGVPDRGFFEATIPPPMKSAMVPSSKSTRPPFFVGIPSR